MKNLKILFLSVMALGNVVGLMGREVDFSSFAIGNRIDRYGKTLTHNFASHCHRSLEELSELYTKAIDEQFIKQEIAEREIARVSDVAYKLYMNARKAEEKNGMIKSNKFHATELRVKDDFGRTPIDIVKKRIKELDSGVERGRCEDMLAEFNVLLKK